MVLVISLSFCFWKTMYVWIYRGGRYCVRTPTPGNHKAIGFLSDTGPDPLENHKATNMYQADDGPLLVVVGSSLPSSTKKTKKNNVRVELGMSDKTFCHAMS